jgi:hypothetical protein
LTANPYAVPQLGVQKGRRVAPEQLSGALDEIEAGNVGERRDVSSTVLKKHDQSLWCHHQGAKRERGPADEQDAFIGEKIALEFEESAPIHHLAAVGVHLIQQR